MKHSFSTVQQSIFFAAVISGCILFGSIIIPFLLPIFWAIVLAIVCYPIYRKITEALSGRSSAAALITIVLLVLCVGAPLISVATLLAGEAIDAYHWLGANPTVVPHMVDSVESYLGTWGVPQLSLADAVQTYSEGITSWIANEALSLGTATGLTAVKTLLTLYLLFYMLRDGDRLLRFFEYILPLGNARERHLYNTFVSITRALFKGTLVTALIQGALGGILFWIAGMPSLILFTALMTIFACIPGIGPAIVWLPASIIQIALGNTVSGVIILVGGFGVIGMIDNIVRPLLVGRDTSLPDALIMVSILGGLVSYGMPGLIIGPVAAGLALALLEMFASEYGHELEQN
jgi:predicted PurR-regulated permease PerM